ncbi:MAG TPA: SUMF1/EgtB/PvdO family nonheme iron enzyme [Lamprocystis sp. (in: g-proteobacteria)]|nr:SUMF1/EgtB/PvdO family nonheme iron enzyme [Lamprocystis sp. (in: g-proteobacteria)]
MSEVPTRNLRIRSLPGVGSNTARCTLALAVTLSGIPTWANPGAPEAASVVAPTTWSAGLYNPRPLPDDLLVPLPCGGVLTFRPVATPTDSARTALVGPFTGVADAGQRYLLIGKYEVTALQYRAVTAQAAGQPCPAAAATAATAATAQVGVSRIDAVNFAAQLSRWLAANAAQIPPCAAGATPCLPRVDGKPAFVRLPLDSEWEYAARGGTLVSDAVFAQSRYPMPEGLERHAWYQRNADGAIAPIGLRLPNPLGLHDLYGNAWESRNDAYRSDQFPGQVGGDVLRGGGIHSSDDDLRADRRVEVQPYDAAGDVRTADTGFRVVLATPVVTSMGRRPPATGAVDATRPPGTTESAAPAQAPASAAAAVVRDGRLRVHVDAKALVDLDGEVKGAAGTGRPLELTGLSRGTHQIQVRAAGYPLSTRQVDITGAALVEVFVHLEANPEQSEGLLRLTPNDRQSITEQLSRLGFNCRLAQGQFNEGCRQGVRELQNRGGLPVTGYLTAKTRGLIEQRIDERNQEQQAARRGVLGAPVTPPPPSNRYLQFPEPRTGDALDWLAPPPP